MCATFRTSEPARVRTVGRGGKQGVCAAVALASAILLGGSVQVLAGGGGGPNPPDPAEDHVWAGCELSTGDGSTVEGLAADASVDGETPARIAFVVVYSLTDDPDDNDGQAIGDGGSTGPVLCINPDEVDEITAFEADGETELTEQSDIPTNTDESESPADTVDVLETEEAFIIKYRLNGGDKDGEIEKRICHTVDENVDCFIISPLPPDF